MENQKFSSKFSIDLHYTTQQSAFFSKLFVFFIKTKNFWNSTRVSIGIYALEVASLLRERRRRFRQVMPVDDTTNSAFFRKHPYLLWKTLLSGARVCRVILANNSDLFFGNSLNLYFTRKPRKSVLLFREEIVFSLDVRIKLHIDMQQKAEKFWESENLQKSQRFSENQRRSGRSENAFHNVLTWRYVPINYYWVN